MLRLVVILGPAVVGFVVAWTVAGWLGNPDGLGAVIGWLVVVVGATVLAVVATQRLARRLLPLSWLLTLTLAFPERAPSRLQTARRAAARRPRREAIARARSGSLTGGGLAAPQAALVLVAALSAHDRRTRGHSERVRMLADVLAEEIGVEREDRGRLRWGALLHDIGKLSVPGEILNKPGRPDEAEWATLQRHPLEGKRLVEPLVAWLGPWGGAVADHHEKWDGSGYPRGVAGEEISLGGRILAVADSYEVMTAARAYKKPSSPAAARHELVASSGTHFDPALVRAFLGISLGRLWWIAGASAALAQLPVLGRLWTTPGADQARAAGSGPAVGVAAVVAAALVGVMPNDGDPVAGRAAPVVAAPVPGGPVPGAVPLGPEGGSSGDSTPDSPSGTGTPDPIAPGVDVPGSVPSTPGPPSSSRPAPRGGTAPPQLADPALVTPVPSAAPAPGMRQAFPMPDVAGPADPPPPSPAAPPPRRELYSGSGRADTVPLVGGAGLGLTELGFRLTCSAPPLTQGLDAVVFELPEAARAEPATLMVTGEAGAVDVVFYSSSCGERGRAATQAGGSDLELPAGVRYVVVTPRAGTGGEIGIVVRSRE